MKNLLLVALVAALPAMPQQLLRRSVRAVGNGVVSIRPDAARINVSVVRQAATAADAAAQDATAAAAVIAAIRQLLGPNADVRTLYYNLTPLYRDQQLTGFSAQNTIQAVATDPTAAGRVIDTAVAAGANRVDSVQLFLRNDESARSQALRAASLSARNQAEAVAMGLGVRLGQVITASEGVNAGPIYGPVAGGAGAAAVTTPIETGTLEVRANVTVDFEIAP